MAMNDTTSSPPDVHKDVYALIIGINKYKRTDVFPTLHGAVNDAKAFESFLLAPCEERGLGVPSTHIKCLIDGEATREGILSTFTTHLLDNKCIPDGGETVMILFFSGHGTRVRCAGGNPIDPCDEAEALSPVDERTNVKGNYVYAIPDYVLGRLLEDLAEKKGPNITVVIDTCHSGGVGRNVGQARNAHPEMREISLDLDNHLWTGAASTKIAISHSMWRLTADSHVLLAACQKHETARETPYYPGIKVYGRFTQSLMASLRRFPLGQITYTELMNTIPGWSGQTPHCGGERRNRIVFNGNGPGTGERSIPLLVIESPLQEDGEGHKHIERKFRVEMGSVEGVVPGTEFSVHREQDNAFVCMLVAESVTINESILSPKNEPVIIPDGSRVIIADWKNTKKILHVYTPSDFPYTSSLFLPMGGPLGGDAPLCGDIVIERLTSTFVEVDRVRRFPLQQYTVQRLPLVLNGIVHFNYFLEQRGGAVRWGLPPDASSSGHLPRDEARSNFWEGWKFS
ncbi:Metacaspase-7 [Mycena venus]|uniref:Metacaspase-7 n=1 Tax=Mycena venus TaxID=2733690 RepID=A0A8H6X5R2_9AGAR|nr:Metacaspase-7 [Mycena venus]